MVVLSEPAGLLNPRQQEAAAVAVVAVVEAAAARATRPKNITVERAEIPAVSVLVGNV